MLSLAALALVASGCGGSDKGTNSSAPTTAAAGASPTTVAAAAANAVTLKLIAFKPEKLSVKAGAAVTWTNEDASEHTVTSGEVKQGGAGVSTVPDAKFDSGNLKQQAVFTFTFKTPGTYAYYCKIHPATMRGEITVT